MQPAGNNQTSTNGTNINVGKLRDDRMRHLLCVRIGPQVVFTLSYLDKINE